MTNLIAVGQTVRACGMGSAVKLGSLRPAFQGHSTSSKLTRVDFLLGP